MLSNALLTSCPSNVFARTHDHYHFEFQKSQYQVLNMIGDIFLLYTPEEKYPIIALLLMNYFRFSSLPNERLHRVSKLSTSPETKHTSSAKDDRVMNRIEQRKTWTFY